MASVKTIDFIINDDTIIHNIPPLNFEMPLTVKRIQDSTNRAENKPISNLKDQN